MNLREAQNLSIEIRDQYTDSNTANGRSPWTARDYAEGLTIDVADLIRMLMVEDGLRSGDSSRQEIAHELMDIVWSAFVIGNELGIDLAQELPVQLNSLRARFD